MARASAWMMGIGVVVAITGLLLAAVLDDRFLGVAFVLVGAFLAILPLSRPTLDE